MISHRQNPTQSWTPSQSVSGSRAQTQAKQCFRKVTINGFLLLFGWFLATGTHWDILQVTAWAGMWTRHVQTETLLEATASTFSGDQRCSICELVQSGRNDSSPENSVISKAVEKSPLILPAVARVIVSAPRLFWRTTNNAWRCPPAPTSGPVTPPPRHAV